MLSTRYPAARSGSLRGLVAGAPGAPRETAPSSRDIASHAEHAQVRAACIVPALRSAPGGHRPSRMPSGELAVGSRVGSGSGSALPARQHRHGV